MPGEIIYQGSAVMFLPCGGRELTWGTVTIRIAE